jgi:hypothetical protein
MNENLFLKVTFAPALRHLNSLDSMTISYYPFFIERLPILKMWVHGSCHVGQGFKADFLYFVYGFKNNCFEYIDPS